MTWVRRTVVGALVAAPAVLVAACGSSGGTTTAGAPVANQANQPATAAPAALSLPCQPGSGKPVTSSGPMNLTDLSGQDLSCAVFEKLTMNQVNLKDGQLPGATFRSSTLNKVNFNHATLTGAVFEDSTLNFPDFTNADLRGAKLAGAHLNNPIWTGATCPDGTPAADSSCASHLNPLPTENGPAVPKPAETPTTTTKAAPPPPATTTEAQPDAPKAPAVFNTKANGTYRCTGGTVSINGAGSDLHLVGQCDLVVVNGATSHVEIDAARRIVVNGAKAAVIYHNGAVVAVNGAGATARRV